MSGLISWPTAPLHSPSYEQNNITGVPLDIDLVSVVAGILVVLVSLVLVAPSFRLSQKSLFSLFGIALGLLVLVGLFTAQLSFNWADDKITTRTVYKAFTNERIVAEVGVRIGLSGINVTLKGIPVQQLNETIDYNEYFSWEWHQLRKGFQKFAGRINRDYRAAQERGIPLPIAHVVQYFVLDGEKILWGRYYRSAGYYVHNGIWFAIRCWILAAILAFLNLRYSGYFFILTASFIFLCTVIYVTVVNTAPTRLAIPFEDGMLLPRYGWTFYLNIFCGVTSILLGMLILWYTKRDRTADKSEWYVRAREKASVLVLNGPSAKSPNILVTSAQRS